MSGKNLINPNGIYTFYRSNEEYCIKAANPNQAVEALLKVYFPGKDFEHHISMDGMLMLTGKLILVSKEKPTYGWRRDYKVKREHGE